ncbi:MAG: protein kinase, partial [Deltaproteobacteria bacterium]|nr:protein kinase [Deltaproteobacteria bacterium]
MPETVDRICPQCGVVTAAELCPEHHCPTIVKATSTLEVLKPGIVVGGRYKIDRQIGKGGFGAVFLASHVATRQDVVVKVLKPDLGDDDTHVKRFFNEARASSLLSHPNTVRVFDFGQTDTGLLFIAMERLNGSELAQALKEAPDHRIAASRAARIGIAVLKSLSEAHAAGLVHRDLKPDNVFLCKVHGEEEFVKVIDFGIAKPTDPGNDAGLTKTGFTVGTPKYMSPEQVLNKPLDGRSDLYALGVILYQCVAGEVPLAGASPMETLVAHMQTQPVHLKDKVPGLPRAFTDLVMQALHKLPFERFRDADDMREALEAVLPELDAAAPRVVERHTARPSAKLPAASADATEAHGEVFKSGQVGANSTHPNPKPGPTGTQPARPPTGSTPQAPAATGTLEPRPPTGQGLPTPEVAAAETALLEHATLRDPYQPATMTLPTQTTPEGVAKPAAREPTPVATPAATAPGKPLPWTAIGIAIVCLAFAVLAGVVWTALHDDPAAPPAAAGPPPAAHPTMPPVSPEPTGPARPAAAAV